MALSFLLLPVNAYWLGQVEGVWHGLHMSCVSLPMNGLLLLIGFVGLNWILARFLPRLAFTRGELLTIYSMLTVQTVFLGHDNLIGLMGVISGSVWYDTSARAWDDLFQPLLPQWLVVSDYDAVRAFYTGGREFYGSGLEWYWLRPLAGWATLLMLLFAVHTSISVLVAHRWTVSERLSYPIIRLPLELTRGGAPPFLQGLFWYGFALAAVVEVVNGLHYLYPSLPHFPVRELDLRQHLTTPPFSAMGSILVRFYPFVLGMGFLMPTDVLNSCWLFYWFGKLQRLFGRLFGWYQIPRYPFQGEQAAGAMLAVVSLIVWTTRHYLRDVAAIAFGRLPTPAAKRHIGQYRAALILMLAAVVGVGALCRAMGMSSGIVAPFFLLYFVISLGVARIRAEVGPPSHSMLFVNPQDILFTWFGTKGLGRQDLTLFALFWWFNRWNRNHAMPVALEAFRLGEIAHADRPRLWVLLCAMALAAIACAFLMYPALFFHDGAIPSAAEVLGAGADTWNRLNSWLRSPQPASAHGRAFMVGGFALALLLGALRTRFLWWSLHPMGYVLGMSYAVDYYWMALLLASVCKSLLLRYGGNHTYRRALPFFIGLIIGDCVAACSWSLLSLALHKPMYDAWW